ncbi:MAG TPA: dynamin family protein [Polyangiaceae bacterium]|nr:dynamin family protein [Polyangiaceae bacterium]
MLTPTANELLNRERKLLSDLLALLKRDKVGEETQTQLSDIITHLDELFLVVVVGEFNAGKSSVLNALFGAKIMEEGPVPTTAKITILRYGPVAEEQAVSDFVLERRYPAELLKHLNLVDTPGTNSIIRQHQIITEDFIPRADLVLFITSYDRPLSESERVFLEFIRGAWGKRLVFVLNKIDLARENEAMLSQVLEHIRRGCRELLGFEPAIVPVSAELAFAAKATDSAAVRDVLAPKSRFGELETLMTKTLTGPERLAIKLAAPLDTAERLLVNLDARLAERGKLLEQDEANLATLRGQMAGVEAELREGYGRYIAEVDNLILEIERRGVRFLDDSIRIGNLMLLRDRDRFKEEFARQVVRDSERQLEDRVTEAVDWLLRHALKLWNRTLNSFVEQLRTGSGKAITGARSEFVYNREEVFNSIMRETRRRIEGFNVHEEARRILEQARGAASAFLGLEAVAVGIGAVAVALASTAALDVTGGFIAAGIFAALGLIFLPRQKRKAIAEFTTRVEALRRDLKAAVTQQLDREIEAVLAKVADSAAPYVELVDRERAEHSAIRTGREAIGRELSQVRDAVVKEFGRAAVGS